MVCSFRYVYTQIISVEGKVVYLFFFVCLFVYLFIVRMINLG